MTLRNKIDKALEIALSILLGIMVLNVLWQVASRYLLSNPSIFTDELARYLLVWIGLLGAAYASGKQAHVAIEILKQKLNNEQQAIQNKIIHVIILIFSILAFIVGGTRMVLVSFDLGQTSSAMHLPIGYVYLALPISGFLICFYTICDLLNID
ncbi:TRAP transporter small permease [Reichenbachiella versicolor]|uniref:TRAP transporter small permease n=1 Tax=Reichenbachiella versicolor TaxID=1821036 RepID=UPI000D6E3601|nr:TRAP transporter small permease [Reichenbachiella versicolor]